MYCICFRVLKRSIDARQRTIYVNVKLRAFINEQPDEPEFQLVEYKDVSAGKPVVVVGAGPGCLFAALRLIELGLRPIVIERGKNVRERKKDIALISREHKVDEESNYSFGEGGAGAYSDGKLYTRSKKRGSVDKILNVFCQFGASTSILADAHPHIGTDNLPRVIENIREQIIRCGDNFGIFLQKFYKFPRIQLFFFLRPLIFPTQTQRKSAGSLHRLHQCVHFLNPSLTGLNFSANFLTDRIGKNIFK